MKNTLILVAFFLFLLPAYPQQIQIEWQQCYGGNDRETGSDIIVCANGHKVILAYTRSNDGDVETNHGNYDFWLFEIDATGNILWKKTYGGSGSDEAESLVQTSDGYILFGQTYSDDGDVTGHHGGYDYWLIKTDNTGNILWQNSIGSSVHDMACDLEIDSEGNIYVIGASWGNNGDVTHTNGVYDYWFLKLNPEGEIIWDKSLGTTLADMGLCIALTLDGGYIVGGITDGIDIDMTCNTELGNETGWLIKLDSLNNIQWQQCYGGSYLENILEIKCTSDGGYIFLGTTNSNDGDVSGFHGYPGEVSVYDIWVVKINSEGIIEWQRCLGGTKNDDPRFIKVTPDGNYIVGGNTESNDGDVSGNHSISVGSDHWVVKLNQTGEIIWQQCFGGIMYDVLINAYVLSESEIILVGNHSTYSTGGNIECESKGGDTDLWVYKIIDTTVGIDEENTGTSNIAVYPNPARDYVCFKIVDHYNDNNILSITLSNIYGQVIETIYSKNSSVQNTESVWSTQNVDNGIYIYTLVTTNVTCSGKIIIEK